MITSTVLRPDYETDADTPSPIVRDVIAPVETTEEPVEAMSESAAVVAEEQAETVIPVTQDAPTRKKK